MNQCQLQQRTFNFVFINICKVLITVVGAGPIDSEINKVLITVVGASVIDSDINQVLITVVGASVIDSEINKVLITVVGASVIDSEINKVLISVVGASVIDSEINKVLTTVVGASVIDSEINKVLITVVGAGTIYSEINKVLITVVGASVIDSETKAVRASVVDLGCMHPHSWHKRHWHSRDIDWLTFLTSAHNILEILTLVEVLGIQTAGPEENEWQRYWLTDLFSIHPLGDLETGKVSGKQTDNLAGSKRKSEVKDQEKMAGWKPQREEYEYNSNPGSIFGSNDRRSS